MEFGTRLFVGVFFCVATLGACGGVGPSEVQDLVITVDTIASDVVGDVPNDTSDRGPDGTEDATPDGTEDATADVSEDVTADVSEDVTADVSEDGGVDTVEVVYDLSLSGPDVMGVATCGRIDLSLTGPELEAPISITLSTTEPGSFYVDSGCAQGLSEVSVGAVNALTSFYYQPATQGLVTLTANHPQASSGDHALTVSEASLFSADEFITKTLVVYNTNYPGAMEIAAYYQEQRGLLPGQVCPVAFPRGQYGRPDHIRAARRVILEDCLCPLIPEEQRPEPCGLQTHPEILDVTEITHLVFVKGIPPRLTGTGWSNDAEGPSFDYFMSRMLAYVGDSFGESSPPNVPFDYRSPFDYVDEINPAQAAMFAYGRLEAMTVERTKDLIDRTLEAEGVGVQGNLVTERDIGSQDLFPRVTADFAPECVDYQSYAPFEYESETSSWPYDLCRWGTTNCDVEGCLTGRVPGSSQSVIPYAMNVGIFLGDDPRQNAPINQHAGFDYFHTMMRWRKSSEVCTPLCRDMGSQAAIDTCVQASTDYFKQINTDCVGAAPGFFGQQIRSYPVQYYGFAPSGWSMKGAGNVAKTAPQIMQEGGFQNEVFTDSAYAHIGTATVDALDTSTCAGPEGGVVPCPEEVTVALTKNYVGLDEPMVIKKDGADGFTVRVRFRNQGTPGGAVFLRMCATRSCHWADVVYLKKANESTGLYTSFPSLNLQEDHLTWQTAEFQVSVDLHERYRFLETQGAEGTVELGAEDELIQVIPNAKSWTFGTFAVEIAHQEGGAGDCSPRLELLHLSESSPPQGSVVSEVVLDPQDISNDVDWAVFALPSAQAPTPGDDYALRLTTVGGACQVSRSTSGEDVGEFWINGSAAASVLTFEAYYPIEQFGVWFSTTFANKIHGFLDLDGIEVIRDDTGESLFSPELGSFSKADMDQTRAGDYATNAIDRLGAIAFWGSSSHFRNGGWAFGNPTFGGDQGTRQIMNGLLSGRSLGRSLFFPSAATGIFYGDPTYRTMAAHIHNANSDEIGSAYKPLELWTDSDPDSFNLLLSALHGTAQIGTVRWALSSCETEWVRDCAESDFAAVVTGVGALQNHQFHVHDVIDANESFSGVIRLKVWNEEHPERHLNYFVYVDFYNYPQPACPWDIDQDGGVDNQDALALDYFRTCTEEYLEADLNDDGIVDVADGQLILAWMEEGDLTGDLNQDGATDLNDLLWVIERVCGGLPIPEGSDFNEDGEITDADIEILMENYGDCPN